MSTPTSFPEVDALLERLVAGLRDVLASELVGVYLYGSLAAGDYDPRTSDIDFLVVTRGVPDARVVAALERLHRQLWEEGGAAAAHLEGSYLPLAELARYRDDPTPRPWVNDGRFFLRPHGPDWVIQRHVLREHGVTVHGRPIAPLVDPVAPDELRESVRGILGSWWSDRLADPEPLRDPAYLRFAVLTMCRALHALEHGVIVSKPAAAAWATSVLPGHRDLVTRALDPEATFADGDFEHMLVLLRRVVAVAEA